MYIGDFLWLTRLTSGWLPAHMNGIKSFNDAAISKNFPHLIGSSGSNYYVRLYKEAFWGLIGDTTRLTEL